MSVDTRPIRPTPPPARSLAVYTLILRLLVMAAIGYVLWRIGFIIVVVLMAVMLALTLAPIVEWMERSSFVRPLPWRYRRGTATTIVFVGTAFALVGLSILIFRPMVREVAAFAGDWPQNQKVWAARVGVLEDRYSQWPPEVRKAVEERIAELGAQAGGQAERLAHRTADAGMLIVEMILIPVLAFSFLTESRPLKREFLLLLPRRWIPHGLFVIRQTGSILQSYAIGQLILALIAGIVVWLLMVCLGNRFALALAMIAAVTRVIPVIGPILGGVPIVLIATLQGWQQGLTVLIAFTIMHLIESKVVMPRIIGHRIDLHPALVIIVLLIGAEFFGMWGMFLAAPVAAVIRVILHHFLVRPHRRPQGPRRPPPAAASIEEPELERPAVAGVRSHSGAH